MTSTIAADNLEFEYEVIIDNVKYIYKDTESDNSVQNIVIYGDIDLDNDELTLLTI